MPLRSLVFSWNGEGLALCKVGSKKRGCEEVNFVPQLRDKIFAEKPDVIVFNTQGMSRHDSYFHGPGGTTESIMSGSPYYLLTSSYQDKIGFLRTFSKGTHGKSLSLQTSIFVHEGLLAEVKKTGVLHNFFTASEPYFMRSPSDPVQGCLGTYINFHAYGVYLFLNVNLTQKPRPASVFYNEDTRCYNILAIHEMVNTFILRRDQQPQHIVMSGDFNLTSDDKTELRTLLQGPILEKFQEGKDGNGAEYYPTESLVPGIRGPQCQTDTPDKKCYIDGRQSYSQRCLYYNVSLVNPLQCVNYQRVDYGNMDKTTTAAVVTTLTTP